MKARRDLIIAAGSSAAFAALTVLLIFVDFKGGPRAYQATFAATTAQIAILSFWWLIYRRTEGIRAGTALKVIAVICLSVSLLLIGLSGFILWFWAPLLLWTPFLLVHAAANIVLFRRPLLYMIWIGCAWLVAPVIGVAVLVIANTGDYDSGFNTFHRDLIETFGAGLGKDADLAPVVAYTCFLLPALVATAVGLAFASMLLAVRKPEPRQAGGLGK